MEMDTEKISFQMRVRKDLLKAMDEEAKRQRPPVKRNDWIVYLLEKHVEAVGPGEQAAPVEPVEPVAAEVGQ